MANASVKYKGIIKFDLEDKTKKHIAQSSWKKVAMVLIDGDLCEYYSWFLKKRFNLNLQKPLRGAHVTFINDRESDMNGQWEEVKRKWEGKSVDIELDLTPRTDSLENDDCHWWLIIPHDKREGLQSIRQELGLGRPFFGMHMTIGRAVNCKSDSPSENGSMRAKEMNEEHSKYIHSLISKGLFDEK